MKTLLKILFSAFLVAIAWATITASMDRNLLDAGRALWPDPWFKATLVDTYCAFLAIYCWIFYKEPRWSLRVFWLLGVLLLGTFAFASYILIQLFKLKSGEPAWKILVRHDH